MLTEFGAREGTSGPSSLHPSLSSRAEPARNSNFKQGRCGPAKSCALPFFRVPDGTSRGYLPDFPANTGSVSKPVSVAGFRFFRDLNQLERFHVNVENG